MRSRSSGRQRDLRIRYLEADPEHAARGIANFAEPDLDGMTLGSYSERERTSFAAPECEQVDRCGSTPARCRSRHWRRDVVRPDAGSVRERSADLCDLQWSR